MSALFAQPPFSNYVYWPKSLLTVPLIRTISEKEIYNSLKQTPEKSCCDHFIFENETERNSFARCNTLRKIYFATPVHRIIFNHCDTNTSLAFISIVGPSILSQIYSNDPFSSFLPEDLKHANSSYEPLLDMLHRGKISIIAEMLARWPSLLNQQKGLCCHGQNIIANAFDMMLFEKQIGFELFDLILNAGADLDNFKGPGISILQEIASPSTANLKIIHFFITRGLMNFFRNDPRRRPGYTLINHDDNPYPVFMLCALQLHGGNHLVIPIIEIISLMDSLGVGRLGIEYSISRSRLLENPEFRGCKIYKIHLQQMNRPLTLQEAARISIRQNLTAVCFRTKLAALPLPPKAKQYIAGEFFPDISVYIPDCDCNDHRFRTDLEEFNFE